ncbi:putative pyrroline-5-carboxylate reductase [Talaromyces proteolyticus]|uniref:Pyrroline-5-carboxylate reductase n=1 Tax=Talaromyces proteolyticus TaxID=1131652 RepID=A0AAD4KG84_9EURO|nr:putative pyrroline-5-carboxylate reductase [Talaromyces proteolyticus]KAH8691379.1 putative pyrroline-5-carboxylate reductase [Talaromyces proteolyticus]
MRGGTTLAIIGCGQIGTAILEVLLASLSQPCPNHQHQTLPNLSMKVKPTRFIACVNTQESVSRLRKQFGHFARSSFPNVQISQGRVAEAVQQADFVLLACKTSQAVEILGDTSLAESLAGKLLLSTCADLTARQIEQLIYHDATIESTETKRCYIVQARANSSFSVRQSATLISTTVAMADTIPRDFEDLTTWIFSSIGTVTFVPESVMNEASITSSLAPALFTVALEGIAKEAMARGLREPDALHLAAQAMKGTAELVLSKKDENKGLFAIDEVRDKALATSEGSGDRGLAVLRQAMVKDTFAEAMRQGMEKRDPNNAYLYSNW